MLIDFFYTLRAAKLTVSVKEYLTLLEAIKAGVIDARGPSVDASTTSRAPRWSRTRPSSTSSTARSPPTSRASSCWPTSRQDIPLEWLQKKLELELSPEEKAAIEKMGWDELMETLKKRFEEQKERHEGGSKMIGTGGTCPFGAYGYNPQGIRIGQDKGRNKRP